MFFGEYVLFKIFRVIAFCNIDCINHCKNSVKMTVYDGDLKVTLYLMSSVQKRSAVSLK